jgi:hypothetical protein
MSYDRRSRAYSPVQRSIGAVSFGVGKRTLTGELEAVDPFEAEPAPSEPVQREAAHDEAGPSSTAEVHTAAARGVASPATALPHADRIQALFGPAHDVGRIQAHVGGDSAAAMGASAYATGNHVVFDRPPDLHTAAHEATHVVQQAHGVHLAGGVGQVGDRYEQHADAVADRVVAGKSAADLLGPGGGMPGAGAVQRKPQKPTADQLKKFSKEGEKQGWVHAGKAGGKKPQLVVNVRRSDKNDRPLMQSGALSNARGYVWVEVPTGATGAGPYYHFYLIHGDGTPIRGGHGIVMEQLKGGSDTERECEVDRSAVDQIDAGTHAVILADEIDDYTKTKDPKRPVKVLEAGKLGPKRVQVRLDYGHDEGASGIYKAKVKFPGRDGAPDLEYNAFKIQGPDGGSYVDFELESEDAGTRILNLQDSVQRGVATATLIIDTDKDKKK